MQAILSGAILLAAAPAFGQGVQQPVVGSFSAGTTVSVPDRGRISVGGVNRAWESRSRTGFLVGPDAYAHGGSASSLSASVFIHDHAAMDAAVLSAATREQSRQVTAGNRFSDAARRELNDRFAGLSRMTPERIIESPSHRSTDPARFLSLGEAAERRGQPGVAAIHYRVAAKQGSAEAQRRLAELTLNERR